MVYYKCLDYNLDLCDYSHGSWSFLMLSCMSEAAFVRCGGRIRVADRKLIAPMDYDIAPRTDDD